jgi:hypothetical protein
VRRGDDEFFAIAKWVVYALIEAEEYGITQANVDELGKSSTDPVVGRILGRIAPTQAGYGQDHRQQRHQQRSTPVLGVLGLFRKFDVVCCAQGRLLVGVRADARNTRNLAARASRSPPPRQKTKVTNLAFLSLFY